jgi:hypothetical protein
MKALFTIFLLVCGATAFAHNGNGNNTTPSPSENNANTATLKENTKNTRQNKMIRAMETGEKPVSTKRTSRVCDSDLDAPGYGIGSYFVEFVHKNNIKLVKLLAD